MKALLLAAGRATRLGSLVESKPKCLLEVGETVILDRIVSQLKEVGVNRFLINTHYLADEIHSHIRKRSDHSEFSLVFEPELLGTFGTLRENRDFFGSQPGWVLHADNFIPGTLRDLLLAFTARPARTWGSMLTFDTDDPSSHGVVTTDPDRVVTGFFEKTRNPPSSEASAATYIFDGKIFDSLHTLPATARDISLDFLPHLVGRMVAVKHLEPIIDIGTPGGLVSARLRASVT